MLPGVLLFDDGCCLVCYSLMDVTWCVTLCWMLPGVLLFDGCYVMCYSLMDVKWCVTL